ncbi:hypothetical protein CW751_05920 [Brumimicrobium salinarum]|uniref:Uncharacterized protein n=1 Tax=Brumimicrobium salinarum TaxID=2058658 RepID=A0A2I0R3G5_9FLAO|nr:hypothetical protein [Brumimicrobium salinarum]PKR81118.1 hypothetical protein CW751_05920 [Brumimicrobium salinarum]
MGWLTKQEANFEKNRFGAMTAMLTFQSCLGSVAAMLSMQNDLWALVSVIAVITMASNAMFIAQADAKTCIITFYISVALNALATLFILIFL